METFMENLVGLLWAWLWLSAAIGTVQVAASKGHTGWEWAILGLFAGVIGLLIAVGVHPTPEFEAKRANEVEALRALPEFAVQRAAKVKAPRSHGQPGGVASFLVRFTIPEEGLPARRMPDVTEVPWTRLPGGQHVYLLERQGAWARVRLDDGQEAWIDDRRLLRE